MNSRDDKIQEMQLLEQNLQNLLMQKQAFQIEFSESESALNEIEKSGDDVFKIIGQLMIKADKIKIKQDLTNKKKLLDLRLKAIEKQELSMVNQLDLLREEIIKSNKK